MIAAILLALALAMDAFAVALTQGARFRPGVAGALAIALTFGLFQAIMPLIGWGIGALAFEYIEAVDHWIAFALLTVLGVRMLGGHVGEDEASARLPARRCWWQGLQPVSMRSPRGSPCRPWVSTR